MEKIFNYYVDRENRTVTAFLTAVGANKWREGLHRYLRKKDHGAFCTFYNKAISSIDESVFLRAHAKCSEEDVWDEETGKRVARERLLANLSRSANVARNNLIHLILEKLDEFRNRTYNPEYLVTI